MKTGISLRHHALIAALVFCGMLSMVSAETPPAFREAAGLYDLGQYEQSAARYESLRAAGVASANLYFNLGNAYFKAGQIGRAILNYERARQLSPRDPDVLGNLRFASGEVRTEAPAASGGGFLPWLQSVRDYLTATEWTLLATISYWLAAAGGIAWIWIPAKHGKFPIRRWVRIPAFGLLIVALVGTVGAAAKASIETGTPAAIVVAKEVVVRFAPVDDAMRHYTAREGQKLWIVGEKDGSSSGSSPWLEVERADGNKGWVPANAVDRI